MKNNGQTQLNKASPALLDELRDLAVTELSTVLGEVLEHITGELLDMAGRNRSHAMYCLYMDTRDQLSAHQQALAGLFGRQMFQRFGEARRRGLLQTEPQLNPAELSLVEPEELELTLASNTVSHALGLACGEELPALEQGMGQLLQDPELHLGPNPLGPDVLGEVLMEVIRTLPVGNKHKLLLVTRLNAHLPGRVKQVYQHVNRVLHENGLISTPRPALKRPTAPDGPVASEAGAKPQADMFAMLQQLMAMGRIGEVGSAPTLPGMTLGEAANEGEMDSSQVMQRLTRIQHGEIGELPGGPLDPKRMNSGTVNVLRVIKHAGAAGGMSPMDSMTLDIVALIFDYILDDQRLPDAMKALIGRLQIPVLKVAMLDKTFFSLKQHPARKFLDVLADAALGWNPQEGHDSLFYQTVETLVQQVLNEFEDKLDVFVQALESLQSFMALEKRQADERACLHAQIVQRTEQAALVRNLAIEAVQASCLGQTVPGVILDFLQGPWASHLANLYQHGGVDGEPWKQGLETMDDLVWSLVPKATKEDRQKLVTLLPKLLKRLDEGIRDVQLPEDERDRFFTALVKFHADAVKAGLQGKRSVDIAPAAPSAPPPGTLFVFDSPEFHDIPLPEGHIETDPRILREISTIPSPLEAPAPDASDGHASEPILPLQQGDISHYEQAVGNLKRGTWIEFTLEDNTTLRAKLAWVSPLRGTYLFTNRLGERAVSINAAGLARKLRDGQARLVDNAALIDRAVSSLFERLKKS